MVAELFNINVGEMEEARSFGPQTVKIERQG
jgi:hypothetical protein